MEVLFIEVKWDKKVILNKEALNYLRKNNFGSIAIFSSIQFSLEELKKQLTSLNLIFKTTRAKRTSKEGQILGCDAYPDSFKEQIIQDCDAVLYVGDGLFHPKAILFSQVQQKNKKDVLIWNPINNKFSVLKKELINENTKRKIRNLRMFVNARNIGILVTTKPGQQYLDLAIKLKNSLNSQGKKAYIFLDDVLDPTQFENYSFIDAWVNTACPRIGLDDILNIPQPVINLKEAFDPLKDLEELSVSIK